MTRILTAQCTCMKYITSETVIKSVYLSRGIYQRSNINYRTQKFFKLQRNFIIFLGIKVLFSAPVHQNSGGEFPCGIFPSLIGNA